MKTFGERVRERRMAKGLTLRAVGEKMGLSLTYMHEVEKGTRVLVYQRLPELAGALDLPFGTVLDWAGLCRQCHGSGKSHLVAVA